MIITEKGYSEFKANLINPNEKTQFAAAKEAHSEVWHRPTVFLSSFTLTANLSVLSGLQCCHMNDLTNYSPTKLSEMIHDSFNV